jgi:hypothetical protein
MAKDPMQKVYIKDFQKIALLSSVFNIFFVMLPFIMGYLFTCSVGKWNGWNSFYGHGEFYLYSVSLLSSALWIYYKKKAKLSDLNSFLSIAALILIVSISSLYVILSTNQVPVLRFIKWASIISILLATVLFYYSQIVDNRTPDVGETRHEEQDLIMKGLQ